MIKIGNKAGNKGFTLIELLVVIAIIGILSSIVLASLNSARAKGADASIKANLSGIRVQAELIYDDANCYTESGTGACTAGAVAPAACGTPDDTLFKEPTVAQAITAAQSAGNTKNSCASTNNQTAWAIITQLKTDVGKGWCIDSVGSAKEVTIAADTQVSIDLNVTGAVCSG